MADKADIASDYIDWRMEQALEARRALTEVNPREVLECVDCGDEIPAARRERLPGVTTCVPCQTRREGR